MAASSFLLKQRAFIKLYLLKFAEEERLYGLKFLEVLTGEFKKYGYEPTHTEVYKALHELLDEGMLQTSKELKEGTKRQEIKKYRIYDMEKVKLYRKQLKFELDRCEDLIKKALKDNYK